MSHEPPVSLSHQCPHCGTGDRVDFAPPPPEVLNTNTPPSDSDAEILYATRTRARLRVHELTERITAIKTTLQSLIDEKDTVETTIADYNKILHPLRSVSVDILTRIFLSCLDDKIYVTGRRTSLDTRQMPWTLSYVSSHWRSVSLSFPRLWSSISVDVGPEDDGESDQPVACLSRQLQRSARRDLLVWIISDIHEHNPLLPLLLSSSTRWKQLSLSISFPNLQSFSPIGGYIDRLQTLYLHHRYEPPPLITDILFSVHSIRTMFHVAPMLRIVVGYEQSHLKPFELPWDRIRELETVTAEPDELLETLQHAPLIESVTCQGLQGGGASPSGIVECPSMQTLILNCESIHNFHLLYHIKTPVLNLLDLSLHRLDMAGRFESIALVHSLQVLIEQSHPPLATLKIISTFLTDDDCLRLIENIPTLRSLTLDPTTCTPKFRLHLANKPPLVPGLVELSIGIAYKPIEVSMEETVLEKMGELMTARGELKIRLWNEDRVQLLSLNQMA